MPRAKHEKKPLTQAQFRNQLLDLMAQKHHWAWSHFSGKAITKDQLKIHFQQEYAVYVRDFPVFLARIHGQNPPAVVRRMLAENIYEEDTGGLSLGHSHPDLFLMMMKGLGYHAREFDRITLLPASQRYRDWLDRLSTHPNWMMGAAVFTIFVEGSIHDRRELLNASKPKSQREIEAIVNHHPLVQYHDVSRDRMDLIRAHQLVESGHRQDAYRMIVKYATDRRQQDSLLRALQKTLRFWLRYRNGVTRTCRLSIH